MDLLPDLVLLEVFSFLSVEERFATLRLVCRRWRQVVEFLTQNDLVVFEDVIPLKKRWPSDNRQIGLLDMVGKPFFDFCLLNGHCKAIKRLFLYPIDWNGLQRKGLMAKLLVRLCQLDELSIDQTRYGIFMGKNWINERRIFNLDGLTLPNLRVLSMKQDFQLKASITAPRLEKLIIWDFGIYSFKQKRGLMISVSHPERLRSLQCQEIDKETGVFVNLVQLSALSVRLDFDLSRHQKLKRLDLCISSRLSRDRSALHETIEGLIERRSELNLNDLEISNFGSKDQVIECRAFWEENPLADGLEFWGKDLDRFVSNFTVDYLPWSILVYSSLHHYSERFGELARSRLNIEKVTICEYVQPDPNLLINFLLQIGGVKRLRIERCSFDSEFYEQLSTVPYIAILTICCPMPVTDFKFLYAIGCLNEIWIIVGCFALDSFCSALKRSKIQRYQVWIRAIIHEKAKITLIKEKNYQIVLQASWSYYTPYKKKFDCLDVAIEEAKKQCKKQCETI